MTEDQQRSIAKDQLTLVLSFFPRADAKISLLLGIDLAMLAYLVARSPGPAALDGKTFFASLPIILLSASLWYLYRASFPQLEGGRDSLIYFHEIGARTEGKFLDDFLKQSVDNHIRDLLAQVWRNSQILKSKYSDLRTAFQLLAWAVIPWLIALYLFSSASPSTPTP